MKRLIFAIVLLALVPALFAAKGGIPGPPSGGGGGGPNKPSAVITLAETPPFTIGDSITLTLTTTNVDFSVLRMECFLDSTGQIVQRQFGVQDGTHLFATGPTIAWNNAIALGDPGNANCEVLAFEGDFFTGTFAKPIKDANVITFDVAP